MPGIPTVTIDGKTGSDGKATFKTTVPEGRQRRPGQRDGPGHDRRTTARPRTTRSSRSPSRSRRDRGRSARQRAASQLPSGHGDVALSALRDTPGRDGQMLGLPSLQHRLRQLPALPPLGRRAARLLRARSPATPARGATRSGPAGRRRSTPAEPVDGPATPVRRPAPRSLDVGLDRTPVRKLEFVEIDPTRLQPRRRAVAQSTAPATVAPSRPDEIAEPPTPPGDAGEPADGDAESALPAEGRPRRGACWGDADGSDPARALTRPPSGLQARRPRPERDLEASRAVPSRRTTTVTVSPGENWASVASSGCSSSMTLPSMLTMMSPSLIPAAAAGVPVLDARGRVAVRRRSRRPARPTMTGSFFSSASWR